MAEFVLKYADARGRDPQPGGGGRLRAGTPRSHGPAGLPCLFREAQRPHIGARGSFGGGRKKIDIEKFLIFNSQFVTLIKAGLPILKGLDLLADRLVDPKLGPYIKAVRDDVRRGSLLSDAFEKQEIFPAVYVTSVLAGEKSGALAEVLDRFITYQRDGAGDPQEGHRFTDLSDLSGGPGHRTDHLPGHIRGPEFRGIVRQYVCAAAADDANPDRGGNDGAKLHSVVCGIVVAVAVGFRIWSRANRHA